MPVKRHQLRADHTFLFKNAKIGYSVIGNGKPAILLHGSVLSNPWSGFENELAKSYKLYIPHLPGFGSSDAVHGKRHTIDLFSDAFCSFVNEVKLNNAPVVAISLGSVVAIKSALKGCVKGELVLVGMPGDVNNLKLKASSYIPIWIRRVFGSSLWIRKNVLIPELLGALGGKIDKKRQQEILDSMSEIDTKSLVDPDPYKEIALNVPKMIPKVKNKMIFIYGENDKLINSTKNLISMPILIKNAGHNIFRSQHKELLEVMKRVLN